ERLAAEKEAAERAAAIEKAKAEMQAALDAQEKENEPAAPAEPEQAEPEVHQQPEQPAEAPADEEPKSPEEALMDDLNVASHEPAEPVREKTEVLEEILDDVAEETKRKEDRERSHWFLKFLLALIIVAAAAEGGTIALRQFAPESPASVITTGIEQQVIQYVETGIDKIKGLFNKQDEQPAPQGGTEQQGEDTAFVLSGIIAENNRNIEAVVENLGIGYDPERVYDITGLDVSELVTDGTEKTAVCKTLIGYNSSWVDYVSGTSQECLNYLKADGAAYRSAVTFDRVGQIAERFVKLQIGEIRKTADSYFVFAGESIEVTEGDETFPSDGFMVYEMVPVGEELKIKDYYDITN
ncbi:MAG: hypothetical protein II474_02420, partial [Firmicutes bacterium]|nr:hypothetical protein [Bacillota bacterium]